MEKREFFSTSGCFNHFSSFCGSRRGSVSSEHISLRSGHVSTLLCPVTRSTGGGRVWGRWRSEWAGKPILRFQHGDKVLKLRYFEILTKLMTLKAC